MPHSPIEDRDEVWYDPHAFHSSVLGVVESRDHLSSVVTANPVVASPDARSIPFDAFGEARWAFWEHYLTWSDKATASLHDHDEFLSALQAAKEAMEAADRDGGAAVSSSGGDPDLRVDSHGSVGTPPAGPDIPLLLSDWQDR